MCASSGNRRPIRSPETVRYQQRPELPGVELRTVFDSGRRYWFYCTCTGFELYLPSTWRGEMWHKGGKEILERGWALAAHPGDVFASKRVLYAGNWHALTVHSRVLAELGPERIAWDRVRLRPFTRMSPRLTGHVEAVVQSIQLDPIACVVANLRSTLLDIADEMIAGELGPSDTPIELERTRLAAVDGDAGAGDPAGARRAQERHDVADLVGAAKAAERDVARDERRDAFGVGLLPAVPAAAWK
jgi:hypothetical protein